MEVNLLQRVQKSLLEKRQNLSNWLHETPTVKKRVQLGDMDDEAVQAHFQVIGSIVARLMTTPWESARYVMGL
jgi:hypothetical protein